MAVTGDVLLQCLIDTPHAFLQPSLPLYTDTITYLKHALDPLALDISTAQQQRLKESRRKRKRGDDAVNGEVLQMKQIHIQGFAPEQIWEQARRVIEAARLEAERGFADAQVRIAEQKESSSEEVQENGDDAESELGEEGVDYEVEGVDSGEEEYHESDSDLEEALDNGDQHDDFEDDDGLNIDEDDEGNNQPAEELVEDKFGLNDGFFSIDDFNRRSEFLEQQDVRGEDEDVASDEEDVDWGADPLSATTAGFSSRPNNQDDDGNEDDDDEDGPTFGDADAESQDEDEDAALEMGEMDVMGGMANTNNVMYTDFFAPPAQKKRKNKKGRPNPHNFPSKNGTSTAEDQNEEDDVKRTIAAVHRNLYEDDDSANEDEDDNEETKNMDSADPRSRKSTHERRRAALAEEIRKLEAANVAKREWVLSGEARAADRPMNSLLEQDLDFERTGKPVPVITAEVSEDIEALIKRRILAHDFQDLIRRRPDDLATGKDSRRGRLGFELDDTKAKKGLAEEYEEEHLRRTDPNFVEASDEKTKKDEREIEAMWNKIRTDLDSLSSWNFRPKAPAPQIDIRVDAPIVNMEDARPSAGGDVAGASQLAPQEVYRAGESSKGVNEEVVGKSGLPAGREEMTREEKRRRRRREKERIHKANVNVPGKVNESAKAADRKTVVGDLKKGGVKVIGKRGAITDVEGKRIKSGDGGQVGGGRFKL